MSNSLFLLYSLSFVPISSGQYTSAINTARDAAFIQSGVKSDYEMLKTAAAKKVPVPIKQAAAVGGMVYSKEIKFKSAQFGDWSIKKDKVQVTWGFSW